jgi:hypothetical protein
MDPVEAACMMAHLILVAAMSFLGSVTAILLMVLVAAWVEGFVVGLAKWWRDYRPYPAIDDKRYANPLRPDHWDRRE